MDGSMKRLAWRTFRLIGPWTCLFNGDCQCLRKARVLAAVRWLNQRTRNRRPITSGAQASSCLARIRFGIRKRAVFSKTGFINSIVASAWLLLLAAAPVFAQGSRSPMMGGGIIGPSANQRPPGLQFVGIEQHLNAEVPGDLEFRDEDGKPVQ